MTTVCRGPLPTTLWHRHTVYACIFYVYVYARERWGRERGASLYMFIVMIYVCALSSSSRSLFMCFRGVALVGGLKGGVAFLRLDTFKNYLLLPVPPELPTRALNLLIQ